MKRLTQEFALISALLLLVCCSGTPEQVHTAFSGSGLSIMWYTATATATSTVRFGFVSGVLDQSVMGESQNYGAPGYHHTVLLEQLSPNQHVYYQVGDASDGWSPQFDVVTARAAGER